MFLSMMTMGISDNIEKKVIHVICLNCAEYESLPRKWLFTSTETSADYKQSGSCCFHILNISKCRYLFPVSSFMK